MTEYVLDYSKWRCGGNGPHQVGVGHTEMLNPQRFMCCLGQFARQKGVRVSDLEHKMTPGSVAIAAGNLYDPAFVERFEEYSSENMFGSTLLASRLMYINDCLHSSPAKKITAIRAALAEHGHTLKVLNAPEESPGG